MVISHKMIERKMGYRGSKSVIHKSITVKEQRVDDNYLRLINPRLRCILTGLERDYLIKYSYGLSSTTCVNVVMGRVSNQINRSVVLYSTLTESKINLNTYLAQAKKLSKMDPFFLTGFTDAEGSFTLHIRSNDKYTSK